MTVMTPEERALASFEWLRMNPDFEQKPASIDEFLGPLYLNIESKVRPAIRKELSELFGDQVSGSRISKKKLGMFTGAIGIGKTTIASIILPYMVHWVLCLKNPQDFYDLLPGSRIAFMMMSTSEKQAKNVLFGDIFARIKNSPWFIENYTYDPTYTTIIKFPKDIWILPGDSAETTFEGYNILGGILDEADSHKVTEKQDYAELGYNTIFSRMSSRFQDRGFVMVIGQMKKATGFAARKYEEMKKDPEAHVIRLTIWESFGWEKYLKPDGRRDSFWYDMKRRETVPSEVVGLLADASTLMEVPSVYRKDFVNNPEKALKDLAGIPPAVGNPFISLTYKITECVEKWQERYDAIGSPVSESCTTPTLAKWFRALDTRKRALHIDVAYSGDGDALGLAMGHVESIETIDGEDKPYIVFDLLYRIKAASGNEIFLADIRRLVYQLKDDLGFRLGKVTMDGFQSTDSLQQFRKRRIRADYLSVDRSTLPYEDLREAIYDGRVEFPPYVTQFDRSGSRSGEIAIKELMELIDNGKKVDHPEGGSKDVADCMAGVVSSLMGDRSYRQGVRSIGSSAEQSSDGTGQNAYAFGGISFSGDMASRALGRNASLPQAPIPGQPMPPLTGGYR